MADVEQLSQALKPQFATEDESDAENEATNKTLAEDQPQDVSAEEAELEDDVEFVGERPDVDTPVLDGHWRQLEGVVPQQEVEDGVDPLCRFLAWNRHGHVGTRPRHNVFQIQHATDGKPRVVRDFTGIAMASISDRGACAANVSGSMEIRPKEPWKKAAFHVAFPAGEIAQAIVCGDDFAAAVTSHNNLRIYSLSGVALDVVSIAGAGVALAARSSSLLVVYRASGSPVPTDKSDGDVLEFRLLDVSTKLAHASGRLPLTPGARLRWLSFSEECVPMTIDTAGVVRILVGGEWLPVSDLSEEETPSGGPLWAVYARQGVIICNELGFAGVEPRPDETSEIAKGTEEAGNGRLREVAWHLPVGRLGTDYAMEDILLSHSLSNHVAEMKDAGRLPVELCKAGALDKFDTAWLTKALPLYVQLIQAKESEQAFDVGRTSLRLAPSSSALNSAAQLAEKANNKLLANEINKLPRLATVESQPESSSSGLSVATVASPQATSRVVRRELAPLFDPSDVAPVEAPVATATPFQTRSAPTPPSTGTVAANNSAPKPADKQAPAVTVSTASGKLDTAPRAAPAKVNPFAKNKRAAPAASVSGGHLLKDACAGGKRRHT